MFLLRVIEALEGYKVRYGLVGGYAVALHGAVRGTLDVDLVLPFVEKQFEGAAAAFDSIGLQSRLPVTASEVLSFREEYMKNRNLSAWSFLNASNPAELVDVVLTHNLDDLKLARVQVRGKAVCLVDIPDLIDMKRSSGRPQDISDIEALEKLL